MSTIYYLIDLTKPQSGGFITSMEAVHKAGAHNAELSVAQLNATQAVVKVVGDQSMLEKPDPQNVIIEEYTPDRIDELLALCYASDIQNPPE